MLASSIEKTMTSAEVKPQAIRETPARPTWKIKLLYDGACPLCLREVNFLRKKDAGRGLVEFVDIAEASYNPNDHSGISFETAMGRIHAVRADGTVINNVEVFRQIYAVLGMGWLYAPTGWPIVGALVDKVYDWWADRRLQLTGRPDLAMIVAQRQALCSEANRCQIESRLTGGNT